MEKIFTVLKNSSVKRIIDYGCGNGKLVQLLLEKNIFDCFACVENSKKRINKLIKTFSGNTIVNIYEQSFFDYNSSFKEYDGAILSEVIEHLTEDQIESLLELILNRYKPHVLIITTPNRSYNEKLDTLCNGFRHSSHLFEFSSEEANAFVSELQIHYPQYNVFREYCDPEEASHIIIIEKRKENAKD